jgi:hypothetical protein
VEDGSYLATKKEIEEENLEISWEDAILNTKITTIDISSDWKGRREEEVYSFGLVTIEGRYVRRCDITTYKERVLEGGPCIKT